MIRLEGGAGLIDKVIRSRRLKALALNRLRFFASSNCDFQVKHPDCRLKFYTEPKNELTDFAGAVYITFPSLTGINPKGTFFS